MKFRELLEQTNEVKKLIGQHESQADYHYTQFKRIPMVGIAKSASDEIMKNKKLIMSMLQSNI